MGDRRGAAGQEVVSGRGGVPRRELGSQPEKLGEKARRPGWSRGLQGRERLDGPAGRGLVLSSLQTRLKSPGTARQLPHRPRVAGLELSTEALQGHTVPSEVSTLAAPFFPPASSLLGVQGNLRSSRKAS